MYIVCIPKLQYTINITFICTGKPKNSCDLLYSLYCGGLEPNPPRLQGMPLSIPVPMDYMGHCKGKNASEQLEVQAPQP